MNPYLIKLKDGFVKDFETDEDSYGGCPTCDYGSSYINTFQITLSNRKISAEVDQMYEYLFSVGEVMKVFLSKAEEFLSMTEDEFIEWFKNFLSEKFNSGYCGSKNSFKFDIVDI